MKYIIHPPRKDLIPLLLVVLILVQVISGCSSNSLNSSTNRNPDNATAEVVLNVTLPAALQPSERLLLEVLDDVTGVYFNPSRYEMTRKDNLTYFTHVPALISSEIKYRYVKAGATNEYEYNARNQQVRFRLVSVTGPEVIQDSISAWVDRPYSSSTGMIKGQAIDQKTKAPIPGLLVCSGGLQTTTASDGSYILDGLIPGTHNLVIYSMDGAYNTFQQGARISEGATTPAVVYLEKRNNVTLAFNVKIPDGYDEAQPLRFVSNMHNYGNAYADLSAGSPGAADNYPVLNQVAAGSYQIKIDVPSGFYLRYKFSFGDGFWNAELDKEGNFVLRELVVEQTRTINQRVSTFSPSNEDLVEFHLSVPTSTLSTDKVYIQFNPFDWMEPIPMVKDSETSWHFSLYNPLHILKDVQYRFCRNGQCEVSSEKDLPLRQVSLSGERQTVNVNIDAWKNLTSTTTDFTLVTSGGAAKPRQGFLAGVEISPALPSNWQATIDQGLAVTATYGGDYVILTPSWSATSINPPVLEAVPGRDLLWQEIQTQNSHVLMNHQKTLLFPVVTYTQSPEIFWMTGNRDGNWWNLWYERYARLILNYADLANTLKLEALIIGDPSVSPSMMNGLLPNGKPSQSPANADDQWRHLIAEIRSRFNGKVIGVATVNSDVDIVPGWLDQVDEIYVLFAPAIKKEKSGSVEDLKMEITRILNKRVLPIYEKYQKPILMGLSFSSGDFSLGGFTSTDYDRSSVPAEVSDIQPDLGLQARLYNAAMISFSTRDYISGFFSRGFYPYLEVQDASSSVYGKPAGDVLWFWYHFLLNKSP